MERKKNEKQIRPRNENWNIWFKKQVSETKTDEIDQKKSWKMEEGKEWAGEELPVGEMGAWETEIPRHDLMG